MTDWGLLGGNPAPGDPNGVRTVARDFGSVADDAEECHRQLTRIRDDWRGAIWKGRAADAFRGSIDDLPEDLAKLFASYGIASDALKTYAGNLESAQDQARTALGRAEGAAAEKGRAEADERRAAGDRGAAERSYSSLGLQYTAKRGLYEARRLAVLRTGQPDPGLQAAYDELRRLATNLDRTAETVRVARGAESSAQSRVTSASGSLRAAVSLGDQARKLREEAAERARRKIQEAGDAGIKNRGWFERALDFGKKLVTGDPDAWATVLDKLKTVANVLSVAALLLGWVPVLGQVLVVAALVVSALTLIGTIVLCANGRASVWDVLIATADVGLSVLGARGAASGFAKGLGQWNKAGLTRAFKTGVLDDIARGARKYGRLVDVMKDPSAKGFRSVVIGFSSNAGAAKRILHYDDARRATGALHHAYAISKSQVPVVLLKRGKDILEIGRDIDEGGLDQAWANAVHKTRDRFVHGLDPTPTLDLIDAARPHALDGLVGTPTRTSSVQLPGHPRVELAGV
jgi:uncharacterized protein YukE